MSGVQEYYEEELEEQEIFDDGTVFRKNPTYNEPSQRIEGDEHEIGVVAYICF